MHAYEEYHVWSTRWSWAFIILLSAALITVCMVAMMMIMDMQRDWDHGNLNFTPSASIYSTVKPEIATEKMIQPLPEGVTLEEEKSLKK